MKTKTCTWCQKEITAVKKYKYWYRGEETLYMHKDCLTKYNQRIKEIQLMFPPVPNKRERATECKAGHFLTGTNLYTRTTKEGYVIRQCKECRRISARNRRR